MTNDQYNNNISSASPAEQSYPHENHTGQILLNGFMDDFYADDDNRNTNNKNAADAENNIPKGIIIARMPDLGDYKSIPNDALSKNYRYDNTESSIRYSLSGFLSYIAATLFGFRQRQTTDYLPHLASPLSYQSNMQFSRLIIVGIIVLFCGTGLIIQNQFNNKNKNSTTSESDSAIIVTKNDPAAQTDNKTTTPAENNLTANNNSPSPNNAQTSPPKTNQNAIATSNTQKANKTSELHPIPQISNNNNQRETLSSENSLDKKTDKKSLWNRQTTDNYSPWMKKGQISFDNNSESENAPESNASARSSEHKNNTITQTSTLQLQPSKTLTAYPSNTVSSGNYNVVNPNNNVERVSPPPYVSSKSIPMANPFHSQTPISSSNSQGRINVTETPDTYRHYYNNQNYNNQNDLRTIPASSQPPHYAYSNPNPTPVVPNQHQLTAAAYPTNPYANPTYPPTNYPPTNYTPTPNANYQSNTTTTTYNPATYPASTYPTTTYPTSTYPAATYPNSYYTYPNQNYPPASYPSVNPNPNVNPNAAYPNAVYPNGTYPPNTTYPHANSRTIANPPY
ncbi:MAG: hypothetical protein LBB88_00090 [Planctomycetaceae bacterium]|jgi:uncharacterized protein (UPF0333 family)|nr:hypothetical protein [Planctomycetaceae bacterium]